MIFRLSIYGGSYTRPEGAEQELQLAENDRLLFKQNNREINVKNGDLGTIKTLSNNQLHVELDSGEMVTIPKTYHALDYGYALTVHKSQGMTVQHTKILIDSKYWDKHLSFVAMTRHKQSLKVYADSINHPNLDSLKQTLSRSVTKDNVIDWPLNYAIRSGFNPDKLIGKVLNHLVGFGHMIKDGFSYVAELGFKTNCLMKYNDSFKCSSKLNDYYMTNIEKDVKCHPK